MPPYLSIIIPAHNEENRLPGTLIKIAEWRINTAWYVEVIVVANGCNDRTASVVRWAQGIYSRIHLIELNQRGKGAAIRAGMLAATGTYRYMCDADLSTPLSEITRFVETIRTGQDVVIGSRELDPSTTHTTLKRRLIGRAFHTVVGGLVGDVSDTQCGFKLFKAQAAETIFTQAKVTGMAFDVEALYLARNLGYKVKEIPVQWQHDPDSRVRLVGDSLQMLGDVISIPFLHTEIIKIPAS